jgi:hypothetical protein
MFIKNEKYHIQLEVIFITLIYWLSKFNYSPQKCCDVISKVIPNISRWPTLSIFPINFCFTVSLYFDWITKKKSRIKHNK